MSSSSAASPGSPLHPPPHHHATSLLSPPQQEPQQQEQQQQRLQEEIEGEEEEEQQQQQQHIHDSPLPWDSLSPDSEYDSLTLPPINSINYWPQELPSFDNNYFDAFTRLASPSLFPLENIITDSPSASSSSQDRPPPSTQPRPLPRPQNSEYGLRSSESPDPYEGFLDLPADMPPPSALTTRASSVVDLTASSPQLNPSKRKRDADTGEGRAAKATKRQPSTAALKPVSAATKNLGDVEVVDLEDVETLKQYEAARAKQQAEAILLQNQEEANRPVKLSSFQCIICMDNPTDLTVTHCGHLFCSECLHSALHAGDKKTCPVCRTAISTGRAGHKTPRNGTFPLEMKLMTVNKKGKQRQVAA